MDIARASAASGISQRMIRHYEAVGVIPPPIRRPSGHRVYSDVDVSRLRLAAAAREVGFDLDEIREIIGLEGGRGDVARWRTALAAKRETLRSLDDHFDNLTAGAERDKSAPSA